MSLISNDANNKNGVNNFKALVDKYKYKLYRIAYSILKDEQRSKDVVQETFIIAWDKLYQLEDEKNINSWLCTIASNKAKDYYRKGKREILTIDDEKVYSPNGGKVYLDLPEEIVEKREFKRKLLDEIQKLDSIYSEVLYLYYFAQLSYKEIGHNLNISTKTVGSRLYRAKQELKNRIESKDYF